MTGLTLEALAAEAAERLAGLPQGDPLSALDAALVDFALAATPTVLDRAAAERAGRSAIAAGATTAQLHEVVVLLSALGVHALMQMSPLVGELSGAPPGPVLSEDRRALWERCVGDDPYWRDFERLVPGFLRALLDQSAAAFELFFAYCALPWRNRTLPARSLELVSLAVDACPTHRFGPGFRLHLGNALKLGVSPLQIRQTMERAARGPAHAGVA